MKKKVPKTEFSPHCVLLGVTGSIAAYKAAEIASQLVKRGHHVQVVMTRNACEFITPLTLQTLSRRPVATDTFAEKSGWHPEHIQMADEAELIVIAPATANFLAKLAHGIADDLLSTLCLASQAPVIAAPAMNGKMWLHPATQDNVTTLKRRGVDFIGPDSGMLACGYQGIGRLWSVDGILEAIDARLTAIP